MAKGTTITTTGVLYINGKQVEDTFANVSKITRKLESELKKLTPGTQEFINKAAEVRQARARFEEMRAEIKAATVALRETEEQAGSLGRGFARFGEIFRGVFSANIAVQFLESIRQKSRETVDELLKVADAMTDVQKTSGMSLEQVKDLWDQFDQMDTRTSKLDRLKIAETAGRLGVTADEMASFVQEIDKAYVALGDSFEGGLEQVVTSLGKIKTLFNETAGETYGEAIHQIGSAMNELAASGTSSEGNIADFALRVGALPDAVKPSITAVLGLGAAFEEAGIDSQIGSSGFSNFMKVAGRDVEKFAKSMNMSVEEAKNLLNTKPEEFFLRFAEGMKGLSADQTAKVMESLGLNTLEVSKAVGAAANKTDAFREKMRMSNETFKEAISLNTEFGNKNNNAPAIIEKLTNAWNDLFTSTNIINRFEWLIQLIGDITGITDEAGNGVQVFKERLSILWNIIKVVTAALLGYQTGLLITAIASGSLTKSVLLNNIVLKAKAVQVYATQLAIMLYNVAMGLLTGNLARARVAMINFNLATKANPIGLLVAVVMAAVIAYQAFNKEVDAAVKRQKEFNQVNLQATKDISKQKSEMEALLKIAQDDNASKEARIAAIKKLNQISPEHLGNLTLENIKTQEATKATNAYTDALYRSAKAKILQKKMEESLEKVEDIKSLSVAENSKDWLWKMTNGNLKLTGKDAQNLLPNMFDQMKEWEKKGGLKYAQQMMKAYGSFYEERNQQIQKASEGYEYWQEEYRKLMESDPALIDETGVNQNVVVEKDEKSSDKAARLEEKKKNDLEKAKAEYAKALELNNKNSKALLEAEQRFIEEHYKIVAEGKKKEWDMELQDWENKKAAVAQQNTELLTANKSLQNEVEKLQRDAADTKNPQAAAIFKSAIAQKKESMQHNLNMISKNNELEEQMELTHNLNLWRIEEKWETIRMEKKNEALQAAAQLERKSAEDMINSMTSMEEARQALFQMSHLKLTNDELKEIRTLEDAKKALRENADRAYLESQFKTMQAQKENLQALLNDPTLSGEALDKLKIDLAKLDEQITGIKGAILGGTEADAAKSAKENIQKRGAVDLLGFSVQDWEDMWNNFETTEGKIQAVIMVTNALANAAKSFGELQRQLGEREMRRFDRDTARKKKGLLKQLNEGYINQEEYHKGLELLEVQTANKRAEISYKQAKAEKAANIMSAIAGTAAAVVGALGNKPWTPLNFALAGLVGAMGALQVGTIAAQPLPERQSFAGGGFTGDGFGSPDESGHRPAGLVHAKEWVAPRWMTEHPRHGAMIKYLESVRTGRSKGYAEGGHVTPAQVGPASEPANTNSDLVQYAAVMSDVKQLLQKLYDEGIEAKMYDSEQNGKLLKRSIKKFEKIENRAARK